jgi:hypothetical protein
MVREPNPVEPFHEQKSLDLAATIGNPHDESKPQTPGIGCFQ